MRVLKGSASEGRVEIWAFMESTAKEPVRHYFWNAANRKQYIRA